VRALLPPSPPSPGFPLGNFLRLHCTPLPTLGLTLLCSSHGAPLSRFLSSALLRGLLCSFFLRGWFRRSRGRCRWRHHGRRSEFAGHGAGRLPRLDSEHAHHWACAVDLGHPRLRIKQPTAATSRNESRIANRKYICGGSNSHSPRAVDAYRAHSLRRSKPLNGFQRAQLAEPCNGKMFFAQSVRYCVANPRKHLHTRE
jgi:hypothetical protein